MATFVQKAPGHLKTLDVSDNPIGDEGVEILVAGLPALEELILDNVGMGDRGAHVLLQREPPLALSFDDNCLSGWESNALRYFKPLQGNGSYLWQLAMTSPKRFSNPEYQTELKPLFVEALTPGKLLENIDRWRGGKDLSDKDAGRFSEIRKVIALEGDKFEPRQKFMLDLITECMEKEEVRSWLREHSKQSYIPYERLVSDSLIARGVIDDDHVFPHLLSLYLESRSIPENAEVMRGMWELRNSVGFHPLREVEFFSLHNYGRGGKHPSNKGLPAILPMLTHFSLKKLYIHGKLDLEPVRAIVDILPLLDGLVITGANLKPVFSTLLEGIKASPGLVELNLNSNHLGDKEATDLAAILPGMKQLTLVDLSANHISAQGKAVLEENRGSITVQVSPENATARLQNYCDRFGCDQFIF